MKPSLWIDLYLKAKYVLAALACNIYYKQWQNDNKTFSCWTSPVNNSRFIELLNLKPLYKTSCPSCESSVCIHKDTTANYNGHSINISTRETQFTKGIFTNNPCACMPVAISDLLCCQLFCVSVWYEHKRLTFKPVNVGWGEGGGCKDGGSDMIFKSRSIFFYIHGQSHEIAVS